MIKERTGETYGRLTVIGRGPHNPRGATWLCRCECGQTRAVLGSKLASGHTSSCGCARQLGRDDLTGKVFGRLTVTGRGPTVDEEWRWICRCVCGGQTITVARKLRRGHTRSCGCLTIEQLAASRKYISGPDNPRWNPARSAQRRANKRGHQADEWRMRVFARDGHQCLRCGAGDGLHAHHLLAWREHPALRLDLDNGATLCGACHRRYHREFGKCGTRESFFRFLAAHGRAA